MCSTSGLVKKIKYQVFNAKMRFFFQVNIVLLLHKHNFFLKHQLKKMNVVEEKKYVPSKI